MAIYSICIPTYRRPQQVERLLSMFEKLSENKSLEGKFEVCISDNNENDETEEIVKRHIGQKKIAIRYHGWGKNVGYDRNALRAMELGVGEYFHLVSDEVEYTTENLAKVIAALENGKPDGLCLRPYPGGRSASALDTYNHFC